jgi:hypothetical protein
MKKITKKNWLIGFCISLVAFVAYNLLAIPLFLIICGVIGGLGGALSALNLLTISPLYYAVIAICISVPIISQILTTLLERIVKKSDILKVSLLFTFVYMLLITAVSVLCAVILQSSAFIVGTMYIMPTMHFLLRGLSTDINNTQEDQQ